VSVDLSGAVWFKSSHSGGGNECVEVAHLTAGHVGVRDSKNTGGPALMFSSSQWDAFVTWGRAGDFGGYW